MTSFVEAPWNTRSLLPRNFPDRPCSNSAASVSRTRTTLLGWTGVSPLGAFAAAVASEVKYLSTAPAPLDETQSWKYRRRQVLPLLNAFALPFFVSQPESNTFTSCVGREGVGGRDGKTVDEARCRGDDMSTSTAGGGRSQISLSTCDSFARGVRDGSFLPRVATRGSPRSRAATPRSNPLAPCRYPSLSPRRATNRADEAFPFAGRPNPASPASTQESFLRACLVGTSQTPRCLGHSCAV